MPKLRLPRSVIAKVANNIPEAIRAFEDLFDGLDEFDDKQETLVSGVNIKTINGTSILGAGNLSTAPTSIAWSIVTGRPTTLAGYGITDGGANLSYDAATRTVASDTGTDAVLTLFTSALAGLTPASGGGAVNFLRADGTWAAPAGGGGGGSGTFDLDDGTAAAGGVFTFDDGAA
jgi:hypothetical protein